MYRILLMSSEVTTHHTFKTEVCNIMTKMVIDQVPKKWERVIKPTLEEMN